MASVEESQVIDISLYTTLILVDHDVKVSQFHKS